MHILILQISLQVIFILLSGYLTGYKAALKALDFSDLEDLEKKGDKDLAKLQALLKNPSDFLDAIRILRLFIGVLFGTFVFFHFWGLEILLAVYLLAVFGVQIPKTIARKKALKWVKNGYAFMHVLSVLMKPFVWLSTGSAKGILWLFRYKPETEEEEVTEEDILNLLDISEETGNIDENEKEWIQNVFDFDDLSVRRVMTQRADVVAIPADATAEEIMHTIEESGRSRYPVYEGDLNNVVGVLYARDFLLALGKKGRALKNRDTDEPDQFVNSQDTGEEEPSLVEEIMRPAYFVPESIHADKLFAEMKKQKIHIALIVDEYGSFEGLVTMEDLVEEIVGNIYDEFDKEEEPELVQIAQNLWKVTGNTLLQTVREELDMELEISEDYETMGGLIISLIDAIPEDGRQYEVDGFGLHIFVKKVKDRRIELAFINKISEE